MDGLYKQVYLIEGYKKLECAHRRQWESPLINSCHFGEWELNPLKGEVKKTLSNKQRDKDKKYYINLS